jgi:hypothetical protein
LEAIQTGWSIAPNWPAAFGREFVQRSFGELRRKGKDDATLLAIRGQEPTDGEMRLEGIDIDNAGTALDRSRGDSLGFARWQVTAPMLVLHGENDFVAPVTLGKRLYA